MIIKGLKHLLVPHHGNNHRPHALRAPVIRGMLALIVLVEALFLFNTFLLPSAHFFAAVLPGVLVAETNHHRDGGALATLTVNPLLEEAARRKAEDMAKKEYFSHVGPEGEQPWVWLKGVGYYYLSAGENLAVNFVDSKDVTDAWMNSPGHRANILNGMFTEVGIGTAEGVYKGKSTTFVVQFFGRPYEPLEYLAEAKTLEDEGVKSDVSPAPAPSPIPAPSPAPAMLQEIPDPILPPPVPLLAPVVVELETPLYTQTPTVPATGSVAVLGSETEVFSGTIVEGEPTMLEFLMTNPRKMTTMTLLIVAFLVAFALLLTIFNYVRTKHADLLVNGLAFLAVVLCAILANDYVSAVNLLIQ